jgi:hypothetical protein
LADTGLFGESRHRCKLRAAEPSAA